MRRPERHHGVRIDSRLFATGFPTKQGAEAKTFLSGESKPEVAFFHSQAVVSPQFYGKSSLYELRHLVIKIQSRKVTVKGKRPHFRLTCVGQKSLCLSSLTTSKERLQKFHTDDVSLPEIWIIKATSFPGSLSYLSLLSRTGRREPWGRVCWVTWLK